MVLFSIEYYKKMILFKPKYVTISIIGNLKYIFFLLSVFFFTSFKFATSDDFYISF